MRIVSLLPSATEIVCQIGLRDQLVGVTHECDYPCDVVGLPVVTRSHIPHDAHSAEIDALVRQCVQTRNAMYSLDSETLRDLQPDLIVTQALCDVCAVAEDEVQEAALMLSGDPRIINLEPMSLDDVMSSIQTVGDAANCSQPAANAVRKLRQRVELVRERSASIVDPPSVVLLEWIDPPFCAGHWSPELVRLAGGQEIIGVPGEKSREIKWQDLVEANPEVLFIACCGFSAQRALADLPILQSQPGWKSLSCVKNNRVFLVDGSEYFNRPGPRLVDSLELLAHTLHPEPHPLPEYLTPAVLPLGGADL